jgi:hypothetical protein
VSRIAASIDCSMFLKLPRPCPGRNDEPREREFSWDLFSSFSWDLFSAVGVPVDWVEGSSGEGVGDRGRIEEEDVMKSSAVIGLVGRIDKKMFNRQIASLELVVCRQ